MTPTSLPNIHGTYSLKVQDCTYTGGLVFFANILLGSLCLIDGTFPSHHSYIQQILIKHLGLTCCSRHMAVKERGCPHGAFPPTLAHCGCLVNTASTQVILHTLQSQTQRKQSDTVEISAQIIEASFLFFFKMSNYHLDSFLYKTP